MTTPMLAVEDLHVVFHQPRGLSFGRRPVLRAVDGVDLRLEAGETLGIVGESGSGKSTVARGILRLVEASSGSVRLEGRDITALSKRRFREVRQDLQMVFQDPYSSLDPSMVVADIVGEPIEVHERCSRKERNERVLDALVRVGLARHHLERYPYEFSGGQRQRIAIARSLVLQPKVVVLDEPVSALDASTQSQIVNLLARIQADSGVSYLFIAHDLAVVRHVSARIAVMYLGRIIEEGPAERVYEQPAHPYTLALLSAIPYPHPRRQRQRERIILSGDPPSPLDPPAGCRFHTRCPFAMDVCRREEPPVVSVEGGGTAACHLHVSGPILGGESVLTLAGGSAELERS